MRILETPTFCLAKRSAVGSAQVDNILCEQENTITQINLETRNNLPVTSFDLCKVSAYKSAFPYIEFRHSGIATYTQIKLKSYN